MAIDVLDNAPRPHTGVMPAVPVHPSGDTVRPVQRDAGRAAAMTNTTDAAASDAASLRASGAVSALSLPTDNASALKMVRDGLSFSALESLVGVLGVPQGEVASIIGIPATTLSRRKRSGRLTQLESDRLMRIARLVEMAHRMMQGDGAAARRWMIAPHELLGGASPLAHASTEIGGREVEQLIGRIRHGTFS